MKDDERVFFILCYILRTANMCTIRDIVNLLSGVIHHKRCWYLLKKWANKGFYTYGVTLDLGWFESEKVPERYAEPLLSFLGVRSPSTGIRGG